MRWREKWRTWINAGEAAIAIGLFSTGIVVSDFIIAAILLLAGLVVSVLSVLAAQSFTRSAKTKLIIAAVAIFVCGGAIILWRSRPVEIVAAATLEPPEVFLIEGREKVQAQIILQSMNCDIVRLEGFSHAALIPAEVEWVKKHYPGSTPVVQSLGQLKRPFQSTIWFDYISIRLPSPEGKTVVFDISSQYFAREDRSNNTFYLLKHRHKICADYY